MSPLERDDLAHALGTTMEFYGKKLDKPKFAFWINALTGKDLGDIKRALLEYARIGRYAPKPVDILDLISKYRDTRRAQLPPPPYNPCPDYIAKAWRWFIPMMASGSKNFDGVLRYDVGDVDPATQDKYILIVNQEAKAQNMPDAIPAQFKLKEVWR